MEGVAVSGKLNVVLVDKGLAERVVNLLGSNPTPGGRFRAGLRVFSCAPSFSYFWPTTTSGRWHFGRFS
jgi:hypothetical protein